MTSEIVVMNKEAVALAADSAGKYGPEGKEKIFGIIPSSAVE